MNNQNWQLNEGDPFAPAAPDTMEHLPSHYCAAVPEDRRILQAEGKHPAPCARFCESTAYEIEIRRLKAQLADASKDAARYRWLVYAGWFDDEIMRANGICEGIGDTVDTAIDAAMKEQA